MSVCICVRESQELKLVTDVRNLDYNSHCMINMSA